MFYKRINLIAACTAAMALVGCGGSSSSPSPTPTPTPTASLAVAAPSVVTASPFADVKAYVVVSNNSSSVAKDVSYSLTTTSGDIAANSIDEASATACGTIPAHGECVLSVTTKKGGTAAQYAVKAQGSAISGTSDIVNVGAIAYNDLNSGASGVTLKYNASVISGTTQYVVVTGVVTSANVGKFNDAQLVDTSGNVIVGQKVISGNLGSNLPYLKVGSSFDIALPIPAGTVSVQLFKLQLSKNEDGQLANIQSGNVVYPVVSSPQKIDVSDINNVAQSNTLKLQVEALPLFIATTNNKIATRVMTISNISGSDVTLASSSFPSSQFTIESAASNSCTVTNGATSLDGVVIAQQSACNVNVVYNANGVTPGTFATGNISVAAASVSGSSVSLPTAYGLTTATANLGILNIGSNSFTPTGNPITDAQTLAADGASQVGSTVAFNSIINDGLESSVNTFVIGNYGDASATNVSLSSLALPFSLESNTCGNTIQSGEYCVVTVKFGPSTTVGDNAESMALSYNNSAADIVNATMLTGNVAANVITSELSSSSGFESGGNGSAASPFVQNQAASPTGAVTYTLTNLGAESLENFYVSSSNLLAATSVSGGTCATATGSALAANGSCTVVVAVSSDISGLVTFDPSALVANWTSGGSAVTQNVIGSKIVVQTAAAMPATLFEGYYPDDCSTNPGPKDQVCTCIQYGGTIWYAAQATQHQVDWTGARAAAPSASDCGGGSVARFTFPTQDQLNTLYGYVESYNVSTNNSGSVAQWFNNNGFAGDESAVGSIIANGFYWGAAITPPNGGSYQFNMTATPGTPLVVSRSQNESTNSYGWYVASDH